MTDKQDAKSASTEKQDAPKGDKPGVFIVNGKKVDFNGKPVKG